MNSGKQSFGLTIGCLLLIVLAGVGLSAAQPPDKKKEPERIRINPGPPACTVDDKVEVTEFAVDPAQVRTGQSVTAKMTIKSKCPSGTADLSVPWKIFLDNRIISNGTARIAAGGVAHVTAAWTAATGSHLFFGGAEPANEKNRSNNSSQDVVINVVQTSADTTNGTGNPPPQLETQFLNYQKAKGAGGRFSDGVEQPNDCRNSGQFNPGAFSQNYDGTEPHVDPNDKAVVFSIICDSLFGARANPEAFSNFTLKNGWKIKAIENPPTVVYESRLGTANWQWVSRPTIGSDNPYMKMHLVSTLQQAVTVYIKVTIEGPAGTDPYQ
jgi:hypothetical protein